jgi:hypothetical protein
VAGPGSDCPSRAAASRRYDPATVTTQTAAWNRPSHRMFSRIAAMVVGGTTAEPMLCHWTI